jgi:hypothetical protein
MPRPKGTTVNLETARQRLAGLKSITPLPDYGPNLKPTDYEGKINAATVKLDAHNKLLSDVEQSQNEWDAIDKELGEWNVRVLAATKAHYGSDSSEYEQVGGTRKSDRKRPTKKKKPTP